MIDTGLVVDVPWVRKILAGAKTWEIRSKPNARAGRIALCEKGGPIVATAVIASLRRRQASKWRAALLRL